MFYSDLFNKSISLIKVQLSKGDIMKSYIKLIFVSLSVVLLFSGCDIIDDDDTTIVVPVYTEPIGDLEGTTWSVTENVNATACDGGIYNDYYSVSVVSQSGNTLTVSTSAGTFSGTFSGDQISWSGTYAQDGGMTTSTTSLTVNSVCSSLSGSAVWTWSDGSTTCSGTSQVTAIRNDSGAC